MSKLSDSLSVEDLRKFDEEVNVAFDAMASVLMQLAARRAPLEEPLASLVGVGQSAVVITFLEIIPTEFGPLQHAFEHARAQLKERVEASA